MRIKEDQVLEDIDLSQDPILIQETFIKPEYTKEATAAAVQGLFVIDVFVNENGDVEEAELTKTVGYEMDELLLRAAKESKFTPRRDRTGIPLPSWATIEVRLILD